MEFKCPLLGVIRRVGLCLGISSEIGAYSTEGEVRENSQYGFFRIMPQALSFLKYFVVQRSNYFIVDCRRFS